MYNLAGEYPDLPSRLLAWADYCVQVERADMAEEREKALQEKIARAAAALAYLAPALDALGVALLHGDPLAELRVRFSDLIPEIEKAVDILGDSDA